jgi:UPF0755 protein
MGDLIKFILRMIGVFVIPLIVCVVTFYYMNQLFYEPVDPSNTALEFVEVRPEKPFRTFCKELADKGLIRHWRVLDLLARLKGKDTEVKAGEYQLSPSMTPLDILAKLAAGEVFLRKVTVKEGATLAEISKTLEAAGLVPAAEFMQAIVTPALLVKAGISAESFEGYLYPETYNFSRTDSVIQVIWSMMEEGEKHWSEEFTKRAEAIDYSRQEVLTLASIIEKEAGDPQEQPLVSSVFHNRIAQGMKLQSDPTVIYGLKSFSGKLTREDLQNPHPYNTYVNYGLPPGPICNPGINAIRAALFPAETKYLFFVADGSGKHVFSTTIKDHNEAVKRYREGLEAAEAAGNAPAAPG